MVISDNGQQKYISDNFLMDISDNIFRVPLQKNYHNFIFFFLILALKMGFKCV